MFATQCQDCGAPVPLLARDCPHCGAPNATRRTLALAAAVAAAVAAAAIIALAIVLRGGSGNGTSAGGDFAWLTKAMETCDEEAKREPDVLHFLVIPVVDDPPDEPGWRRIQRNEIGNAILLSGEDAVAGLKRGALKLSKDEYVLAIRNEATNVVLRWNPASGVKRFSTKDTSGVAGFRVQFQRPDGSGGGNWGATFKREPGNCYWVNAILRL
jgi:hypothetical protein